MTEEGEIDQLEVPPPALSARCERAPPRGLLRTKPGMVSPVAHWRRRTVRALPHAEPERAAR